MRINENQKVTLTIGQLKRLVKESTITRKAIEDEAYSYYVDRWGKDIYAEYFNNTYDEVLSDIESDGWTPVGDMLNGELLVYENDDTYCMTQIQEDDDGGWYCQFVEIDPELEQHLRDVGIIK